MGLQETLEEQRKDLEEALSNEQPEVVEEAVEEVVAEEPAEEVEAEEVKEESSDEEEPKVEEKEPEIDASGYARMRRELAAEKKLRAEAEAKLTNPIEEPVADESNGINEEVMSVIQDRRIEKASQEFAGLETEFSKNVPDYEGVSNAYKQALYQSIRLQNPTKNHNQLLEDTRNKLLQTAGEYVNKGLDPIQEMYEMAKSLGMAPVQQEQAVEEVIKPDLSNIAKNKAKNAGMIAAKGSSAGGQLTREGAATLTTGEWAKLSASEKQRILYGG